MNIGIKIKKDEKVRDFVEKSNKRFENQILTGQSKLNLVGNTILMNFSPTPIPRYLIFIISSMMIVFELFSKLWFFMVIGIIFFDLLQSRYFIYFLMKKGLKKEGYNGKAKLLSDQDLIEVLINEQSR